VSYAYNINLVTKPTTDGLTITNGVTTLASLQAPANTVMLSEVSGGAAVIDGSSGRIDGDSTATFGAYRFDGFGSVNTVKGDTGYLGNPAVITNANELHATGRHTDGSNFVLTDGHAKFLRGPQVSPGTSAMTSTDPQAKYSPSYGPSDPIPTAAGTQASAPSFAATFSTN
jgi:prepilin-type processing-associated H-X9-DG protein